MLKVKPTQILRFSEDIQKVEYVSSNIVIIALMAKIYIYHNKTLHKIVNVLEVDEKVLPDMKCLFAYAMDAF